MMGLQLFFAYVLLGGAAGVSAACEATDTYTCVNYSVKGRRGSEVVNFYAFRNGRYLWVDGTRYTYSRKNVKLSKSSWTRVTLRARKGDLDFEHYPNGNQRPVSDGMWAGFEFTNDGRRRDVYFEPGTEGDNGGATFMPEYQKRWYSWNCEIDQPFETHSRTGNSRCRSVNRGEFKWGGMYSLKLRNNHPWSCKNTPNWVCVDYWLKGERGDELVNIYPYDTISPTDYVWVNNVRYTHKKENHRLSTNRWDRITLRLRHADLKLQYYPGSDNLKPFAMAQLEFLNDNGPRDVYFTSGAKSQTVFMLEHESKWPGWNCAYHQPFARYEGGGNPRCKKVNEGTFAWRGTYALKMVSRLSVANDERGNVQDYCRWGRRRTSTCGVTTARIPTATACSVSPTRARCSAWWRSTSTSTSGTRVGAPVAKKKVELAMKKVVLLLVVPLEKEKKVPLLVVALSKKFLVVKFPART